MRRWVKALLFTGIGIIAAGIIALFIAFAVNGFSFRRTVLPIETKPLKEMEKTIEENFTNLLVETGSADITLKKADDGICRIQYKDYEENTYKIGVEEDTLVIKRTASADGMEWKHLDQIINNVEELLNRGVIIEEEKITIFIPERAYKKLEIAVASGEITSELEYTFDDVELTSASGDIRVQNMNGTEGLCLTATSGEVSVQNVKGYGQMEIATTSGAVSVMNAEVSSRVNIASTSGEVRLKQVSTGKADIVTTSGEVLLVQTKFTEGKAETTSGEIYVEYAEAEKMQLKTVSGGIYGKIDGDINVQGKTSSGEYSAPSGTKWDWKTETVSGDVELTD